MAVGSSGDRLRQTRLIPRSPDGDKKNRIESVDDHIMLENKSAKKSTSRKK